MLDRRRWLAATAGFMAVTAGPRAHAQGRKLQSQSAGDPTLGASLADLGITLKPGQDAAPILQAAIDQAAARGVGIRLPPGKFALGATLRLRPGTSLAGSLGATRLMMARGAALVADGCSSLRIEHLVLDADFSPATADGDALLRLADCIDARLTGLELARGMGNGISLLRTSGSVTECILHDLRRAAIAAIDPPAGTTAALDISHNHIRDCGDNGILAWTSKPGELGATITDNRIERIAAKSGGTGQNGNGINVYRAAGVIVANNRIADCAYSAVRGNAASNLQIMGNNCARLGEVALYAEFGFEGAVIANNIVDTAASGVSVTNFNEGGRLAVVQGNLVRNLFRREQEPEDKRGEGISVEADTLVSNNVVEGAPTAGIFIGWGAHMREVVASGNLVRNSRIGIAVQAEKTAGVLGGLLGSGVRASTRGHAAATVLLASNRISGARDGAIRTLALQEPFGPDLAVSPSPFAHVVLSGNVPS